MKTKIIFPITLACILSSLALTGNTSAVSKNNLNIIYDDTPTDSASFRTVNLDNGRYINANAKYTSTYNFLSEAPENPSTFDNVGLVFGVAVVVLALVLEVLYSNSRRGFSKKACFALVLAVFGIIGGAFALSRDNKIFADEYELQTIVIRDKTFYNALKDCFGDNPKEYGDDYSTDGVNYDSGYYYCYYYGNEDEIVFDDDAQSVTLTPQYVYSLDMHSQGLTDISDLLNFRDLEYFYAYNNNITDVSILTEENFPHLVGYIGMDYNHLSDIENADDFYIGTIMAQSVDINVDSDGNAEVPGIFHKAMDFYIASYNKNYEYKDWYDLDTFKIPVHIHNIELSDDLKTAHVINPGEKAYLSFSFEEDEAYCLTYSYSRYLEEMWHHHDYGGTGDFEGLK